MKYKEIFWASVFLILASMGLAYAGSRELYNEAYLIETGQRNLEQAVNLYRKVIDQSNDDVRLMVQAYLRIGICEEKMEKLTEAATDFQKALSLCTEKDVDESRTAIAALSRIAALKEEQEKDRLAALYSVSSSSSATLLHNPRFSLFASLELFAAGDEDLMPSLATTGQKISHAGFPSQAHLSVKSGLGIRLGMLVPFKFNQTLLRGLAVDFVSMPDNKGSIRYGTHQEFSASIKESISYYRLLAIVRKRFSITDKFSAGIDGGLGGAFARNEATSSSSPFDVAGLPNGSSQTIGLTWEIGPSLIWDLNPTSLVLAVFYSHFPDVAEPGTAEQSQWNPFGASFAVHF